MQEGATPVGSTPAEFERFVHAEIAKWTRIIQAGGHQAAIDQASSHWIASAPHASVMQVSRT